MEDVTQAVLAVEQERLRATVAVDVARLEAIYDDELVYIHSSGKADDKAAVIAMLEEKRHIVGLVRGELRTVAWTDGAVVSGPIDYTFRGPDGSEIGMAAFATQTFRRSAEGWKIVAFQATTLKPPATA